MKQTPFKKTKPKEKKFGFKLPEANRIKPKAYKNKKYLSYMHNSGKVCFVCGDCNIELHHIKDKDILGRDDSKIIPLCPEHHRGRFSPHGADAKEFYEDHDKVILLLHAIRYFNEFEND